MFESNNTNRALTLKHQLQNIKMTKADTIATFFMNISEIRDQLGAIGETTTDRERVMITLNALPRHWEPFLQSISGRTDLSEFDRLWTNSTQEETRLIARGVQDSHHDDNQALASHTKRGRRNRRSFGKAFKDKKLQQLQVMNKEKTIQRFNVLDVTSMDALREIVPPERKEDSMHPLQMLIQNHLREMKT
jgi:hypothetical protein